MAISAATTADQAVPPQTGDAGEPSSPLHLGRRDWKATLKRTAGQFKEDRATLVSAGMAFYWFLAIFPALLAAVGVLGLVGVGASGTDSITRAVRSALPGDAASVLTGAIETVGQQPAGSSVVAVVIGIALALWGASAGMVAMQAGLDVAYDVPEERKLMSKRLVGLVLLVATAVLGGLATALVVFGAPLGDAVADALPFGGTAFTVAWTAFRWIAGFAALSALFATFYYLGPNRPSPRWAWLSPGGLVAALIWLAASAGFSLYVSTMGSYAETYGSLTGVVVLLLWLFLSALAVITGAELNAELERQAAVVRGDVPPPEVERAAVEEPVTAGMGLGQTP